MSMANRESRTLRSRAVRFNFGDVFVGVSVIALALPQVSIDMAGVPI